MAIELVSYADLKSLLGLEDAAITDYPELNVLRESVTSAFEAYTGRLFESIARTKTIYVDAPTQMIRLGAIPVTSVASLVVTVSEDDETYTQYDDYEIRSYGLRLLSKVSACTIAITYTGGILTAPTNLVPDSLERAALLQTAYEFQAKDQIGSDSVTTEGGTISRPALGLLKEVKRLLDQNMHPLRW